MQNIHSPLQAQLVQWLVAPGAAVAAGDVLVILEAMKMEHEIRAPEAGLVGELFFQAGEAVAEGEVLASLTPLADPSCCQIGMFFSLLIKLLPSGLHLKVRFQ